MSVKRDAGGAGQGGNETAIGLRIAQAQSECRGAWCPDVRVNVQIGEAGCRQPAALIGFECRAAWSADHNDIALRGEPPQAVVEALVQIEAEKRNLGGIAEPDARSGTTPLHDTGAERPNIVDPRGRGLDFCLQCVDLLHGFGRNCRMCTGANVQRTPLCHWLCRRGAFHVERSDLGNVCIGNDPSCRFRNRNALMWRNESPSTRA